ncbi:Crp/Fnr family transcriptional regulator [Mucilaginibacter sp. UR6-11]|uniref:Crp/Fnr family transcriptional regulator n=1 Tax=Mucilaginibacter sp. UR6-11 TaxID=1435644 RepID=UPI001E3FCF3F|nr:Crp/Fnr family transcriptional regulator [Mucilaginibacter sp. UR6-11]MCC8426833.1 Crp/Fnr family transcriptional regulator [Mucilaginibacter sp. UR6-11]
MHLALLDHMRKYVTITDEEATLICTKLKASTLKKKDFLLQPGKVCRANYFVSKGLLRLYFINKKEQEQITQFGLEGWWITDYDSLDTQKPSRFYIQAVEDAEVIAWDKTVQEELTQSFPQLETYFRKILQRAYAAAQRRIEYIYSYSDEERYRNFSTNFPGFVQRVPQYMLASYLGFTPQFLSKIRAKK